MLQSGGQKTRCVPGLTPNIRPELENIVQVAAIQVALYRSEGLHMCKVVPNLHPMQHGIRHQALSTRLPLHGMPGMPLCN